MLGPLKWIGSTTVTSFMDRLGDRCNPILVKEIRQAVYSGYVTTGFLLLLGVELVMTIWLIINTADVEEERGAILGQKLFDLSQTALFAMCIVLMPLRLGVRFASERRDAHENLLFITALSPRAIITGKLLFAAAIVMLVFSALAPLIILCFALGGPDIQTIVIYLAVDILAGLFCMMLALLLISIGRVLGIIFPLLSMFLWAQKNEIVILLRSKLEFWHLLAGLALVGMSGLMFTWTIALLSPAAANRAFAVRLYTLCFWLLGAIVFGCLSLIYRSAMPVHVAGVAGLGLFGFQMLISISERDSLGPRVIRDIPKRFLLRIPAFLLYSGSAGGLIFSTIGLAVSVIWVVVWREVLPDRSWGTMLGFTSSSWTTKRIGIEEVWSIALIAGYTYCYCMTAVAVRRLFRITPSHFNLTLLIVVILFLMGRIIPVLLYDFLYPNSQTLDQDIGFFFTSPIEIIYRPRGFVTKINENYLPALLLLAWAVTITLLNARWFLRQIKNFRPSSPAVHIKPTEILMLEPTI